VLDGRQLGPICRLAALPLPRAPLHRPAGGDDAARSLFFQVGHATPATYAVHVPCLGFNGQGFGIRVTPSPSCFTGFEVTPFFLGIPECEVRHAVFHILFLSPQRTVVPGSSLQNHAFNRSCNDLAHVS
jgi:hypothetical protein